MLVVFGLHPLNESNQANNSIHEDSLTEVDHHHCNNKKKKGCRSVCLGPTLKTTEILILKGITLKTVPVVSHLQPLEVSLLSAETPADSEVIF